MEPDINMTSMTNPASPRWIPAGRALQAGHRSLSFVHAAQK
jgi:hypothetical protein